MGTVTQAMHEESWRGWVNSLNANTTLNSEPTVCSNKTGGRFYVVRNSDNKFYIRQVTHGGGLNAAWKQFGSTTFASPPTCIMQKPYPNHDNLFVIAGKGTDNTLYAAEGNEIAVYDGNPPANPSGTGTGGAIVWSQVGMTTYAGDNGRPALASKNSQVAMFYMNNNRVYARYRGVPYASSSWAPAGGKQGPLLPEASTGVPGVVYQTGAVNRYVVLARAVGSDGFARVYYTTFDGTNFESTWNGPLFIPYSVDSDLAVEHDPTYDALTIYFRSGNDIIQTSVPNAASIGAYPFYPVRAVDPSAGIVGAPRVNYGGGLESFRVVVVRGHTSITPVINRGILINDQGGTYPSPWPSDWE